MDVYGDSLPRVSWYARWVSEANVTPRIDAACDRLESLLPEHKATRGLLVRKRGKHLTLVREEKGASGAIEDDPRVRLTHLGGDQFGVSVFRHTGKWERTPFTGTIDENVNAILETMQHIVADWP